jgi:tRNA nucleotidyltransferase (CCA-adding enzyme)
MKLAVAHNNMDFDSLAAQFAVTKLYPSARMALGYPLYGNIRSFLTLYRGNLPIVQPKYIELNQVSHLYLVDNQNLDRLDATVQKLIRDGVPYTIFDHHEPDPNGLAMGSQKDSIIAKVGAATTLLVEQLSRNNVDLTAFEATLLAIGIYEDSGCLTYLGTSSRDASCVSFLLEKGADLKVVNEYIRPQLTDQQQNLFQAMIKNAQILHAGGKRIVLSDASLDEYLDGLATLTRKLLEVESADAAFSVVRMRDRIHLVGRSESAAIDTQSIARAFSGDGHTGAASAVIKSTNTTSVLDKLRSILESSISQELTAAEMMVTPVRTIHSDLSMEEASKLMIRYAIDGLLVTENDSVIGVISRRDVDQAIHHKLAHAPVTGFMSSPVLSISPETTLSEIRKLLIKNDIGRLPVLDKAGHIMGLVSRHDVLRRSFSGKDPREFILGPFGAKLSQPADNHDRGVACNAPTVLGSDLKDKIAKLGKESLRLFQTIGKVAADHKMVAYAVGGSVRDLILGYKNFDFDFVVEGSAIELSKRLAESNPEVFSLVARHERFQTATIAFKGESERLIDLSTARIEFYEFPAALPTVEPSLLEQDLFRRDFTINALAVKVNPDGFGQLFDYFDGLKDLENGVIRILHQFSFIEDPTRILRAARFTSRFGFVLETKTQEQAKRAISIGIFDNLGGVRLKEELKLILQSRQRLRSLEILSELGGRLRYLDDQLEYGAAQRSMLRRAEQLLARYPVENPWIVYLALLLGKLPEDRLPDVLSRLHLSNEETSIILRGLGIMRSLANQANTIKKSEIYELLSGSHEQSLAIAACAAPAGSPVRRLTKLYMDKLQTVGIELTGKDLLKMGFAEGPHIGQLLKALLTAKLDGAISTKAEELAFAKQAWAQLKLAPPSVQH